MYLTKDNAEPDPSSATYKEDSVHHVKKRKRLVALLLIIYSRELVLTRYIPRAKIRKERNLLQDNTDTTDRQEEPEV
jgi:hypothetical protein